VALRAGAEASLRLYARDGNGELRATGSGMLCEASSHAFTTTWTALLEKRSCGLRIVLIVFFIFLFRPLSFSSPFSHQFYNLLLFINGIMDSIPQHPIKHNGHPQPGNPPSGPQQPISQPYWRADFDPSTPLSAKFTHEIGVGDPVGWGNSELEYYTDDANNSFYRGDKKLVVRAVANSNRHDNNNQRQYTSARITSVDTLGRKCGFLAAVLTPPCASGVWPAFWMLPKKPYNWPTDGEVDIFESWNGDLINHHSLHWGKFIHADNDKHLTIARAAPGMARPEGTMYGFAWDQQEDKVGSPGRLVWYLDGKPTMKTDIPAISRKMSDFTILFNVALGGNLVQGAAPIDGVYELVVHSLEMYDAPPGGWSKFENDYKMAAEGQTMNL
jgi:hypothetical protein